MVGGRAPTDRAGDYVGVGFTGVKGHKPPGFFSDQHRMRERDGLIELSSVQSAHFDFAGKVFRVCRTLGKSLRLIPKEHEESHTCERILRTMSAKIASPALFPQPPQRKKNKTKKMLSQFHAWQNFLFALRVAKTAADRGNNICGRRYVVTLEFSA